MTEQLEVIANIYNDGCPPNNYHASLCIQGVDSGRVYAYSSRNGSTIDELADDIRYALDDRRYAPSIADPDIFSRIYFVSQVADPLGIGLFQEGSSVRHFTEEEFQELREKVEQPFTEEECEAYVDRYRARLR